jgi:hypothetical protein
MTRGIAWLVSAALLFGAAAAAAASKPLPCSSVSPEVREYVRSRGACRDIKPAPRRRASTKPRASGSAASAPPNHSVPHVIGRSFTDAVGALSEFKVERVEAASAAPAGEVLAQEPAPAALGRAGSTVILKVSDGSLAGAPSMDPATVPAAAVAASSAPATNLAPDASPVALPPQEPIDPPGARGQLPTDYLTIAALIFGAGSLLGLLSGALLMRRWLQRGQLAVRESALPYTPAFPQLQRPVERRTADQQRADQQPADPQPADPQPAESDAGGLPETSAPPEIQFTAWLVPSATTIALAPRPGAEVLSSSIRATTRYEQVRLVAPIEVSGDGIERALSEQSKDETAVARVFEQLRGAAAQRAADELNRALDVDILDVLAQGWVRVQAMHGAVQLSAVKRGPPVLVKFDVPHSIASTSYLVLDTRVAGSSLPRLELALEVIADIQSAIVAARDGRIELVALGEATVLARLKYKSVLLKEHVTEITGTPFDPSEPRPTATERPASVDFRI